MPKFIFRGEFSKGLDTQTQMDVTFRGREPSEVTDLAAISWLAGNSQYELVPEPVAEEPPVRRIPLGPLKKAPAKKKSAKAKK
jgi:hypothetical protein